ncbi:3-hydroxyacyl-CoA dehydrogenase family protein [Peribacillus butanolivorans]|uniref:3-hydroxyacyl-CoA dehydrogenase family protein n=1 Tax=Peribacillus butanolivorans TaxID=421767 RepID=UPI00365403BE
MKNISVIGAGTMGRGIAYVSALGGFNVVLNDVSEENLHKAQQYIEKTMRTSAEKGFLQTEEVERALTQISYSADFNESVKEADLVIEAVFELMSIKIDMFKKFDEACPPHTILATNTSTMSPTEIAAQTKRPDQCIAMHFFNPVHKMKLIEVVRGLDTSNETVAKVMEFGERIGKECVEVNEFPGFVTSRMNCLIGNEAMNMLMEGIASPQDIDKAMKLGLNHPMGPLELADLVGLDSRLRNMEYLYQTLGEKYRPSPILVKYVKAGRLGKKSGKGFYDYTN